MAEFIGAPYNTIITAVIDVKGDQIRHVPLGMVQAIAYRLNRTKAPVHVLGRKNPIATQRGSRRIAGTMDGVLLSKNFYFAIAQHLLEHYEENSRIRLNLKYYIENVLEMDVDSFVNNIVLPVLKSQGADVNGKSAEDIIGYGDFSVNMGTASFDVTKGDLGEKLGKLPPLYLDDIPPIDLVMVTPLQINRENQTINVEIVEFKGLEFINSNVMIRAGDEAIAESVTFIARAAFKRIEVQNYGES